MSLKSTDPQLCRGHQELRKKEWSIEDLGSESSRDSEDFDTALTIRVCTYQEVIYGHHEYLFTDKPWLNDLGEVIGGQSEWRGL